MTSIWYPVVKAMSRILEDSPNPSNRKKTGSSTIFGNGYVIKMRGAPSLSASLTCPSHSPNRNAAAAAIVIPTANRRVLMPRCVR